MSRFVLTGVVANQTAGPAVALSFVVAGIACALAAMCYAEFASTAPVAGSAYTLKYRPEFPASFAGLPEARMFCRGFFDWYNTEHQHSNIAWHTPHNAHHGHTEQVHAVRAHVLTAAYTRNPERFVGRPPEPATLPVAAWINKPEQEDPHPPAHSAKP